MADVSNHVQDFIQKTAIVAQMIQRKYRIPASVVIAQAALETGWGKFVKGNAYFGIKGKTQTGDDSIEFITSEFINEKKVTIRDTFRAYSSFKQAAEDYGRFLTSSQRYKEAFKHTDSPPKFVDELQKAGYATDPNYAIKLKNIIQKYNLTRYDKK